MTITFTQTGRPPVSPTGLIPVCFHCQTEGASNNRLLAYSIGGYSTRNLCTRCRNTMYVECRHDGAMVERSTSESEVVDNPAYLDDDDEPEEITVWWCFMHLTTCDHCHDRVPCANGGYCDECRWWCEGCDTTHPVTTESNYDERDDNSYCNATFRGRSEGVRGYGRTVPSQWFGGPLPRDEKNRRVGYYLGFELEIYSENFDARAIHEYATDNNMAGFFDVKEDSSVEGFEIATQPFTPEFFERIVEDGRLQGFFDLLNDHYPLPAHMMGEEFESHGLHVHVGRVAFDRVGTAAFCYLIGQDEGAHLERIARREPTGYCGRVIKPVSTAIVHAAGGNRQKQAARLYAAGNYPGRNAINLTSSNTIEIRAFKSTRDMEELANAVRLVYVGAEYVRWLRSSSKVKGLDPKALEWESFVRWSAFSHPQAFASLAGIEFGSKKVRSQPRRTTEVVSEWSIDDFVPEVVETAAPNTQYVPGHWQIIDPMGCGDRNCCSNNFEWVPATPLRGLAAVLQDAVAATPTVSVASYTISAF